MTETQAEAGGILGRATPPRPGETPPVGTPAAPLAPTATKPGLREGALEMVRTIVYAVAIALIFRTFLFQPFSIPSASMEPTLLRGDYIFVNKFVYGYRFRWLDLTLFATTPRRGDVMVFKHPTEGVDYIKRVVGLPGDRVQVTRGRLYLNDQLIPRQPVEDTEAVAEGPLYIETLPHGMQHLVQEMRGDIGAFDNTPVFTVPAGHFLMMGDNRDNSTDSRSADVGFVPDANMVGRAEVVFFSLGDGTSLYEVWRWPFTLRLNRLARRIR